MSSSDWRCNRKRTKAAIECGQQALLKETIESERKKLSVYMYVLDQFITGYILTTPKH